MSDANRIVSKDDISRILKNGETSNAEVSTSTSPLELEIVRAEGLRLVLGLKKPSSTAAAAPLAQGTFPEGAGIEIVFSLIDGQYAIRDAIRDVTPTTFTVDASDGILRLQRRNDFRVAIARGSMRFAGKTGLAAGSNTASLELIDLSAGGLRLLWPLNVGPIPRLGERLSGKLVLKDGPNGEEIDVTVAFVKDHGPDAPLKPELGNAVSFKFESLSQGDARIILFACVGVYRNRYGF